MAASAKTTSNSSVERVPTPVEMVLLSLMARPHSGRHLARRLREATGRSISYGSLYTTLRRMRDDGLVEITVGEDRRERLFQITGGIGKAALAKGREYYAALSRVDADVKGLQVAFA